MGSALDRLIAAGLLFRQGVPPHARYLFKHSLVQDVAYGSLLRSKRHQLHAEIAAILESQFRDTIDSTPRAASDHYKVRREVRPRDPIFDTRRGCRGQPLRTPEATVHYQAAFDMASELQASDEAGNARVQASSEARQLATGANIRTRFTRPRRRAATRESGAVASRAGGFCTGPAACISCWVTSMRGVEYAQQALRVAEEVGGGDDLTAEPINRLARIHCLRGEPARGCCSTRRAQRRPDASPWQSRRGSGGMGGACICLRDEW